MPEWRVRYTYWLYGGKAIYEDRTFDVSGEDRHEKAGRLLQGFRWHEGGIIYKRALFPAHRIESVTWEVLDA